MTTSTRCLVRAAKAKWPFLCFFLWASHAYWHYSTFAGVTWSSGVLSFYPRAHRNPWGTVGTQNRPRPVQFLFAFSFLPPQLMVPTCYRWPDVPPRAQRKVHKMWHWAEESMRSLLSLLKAPAINQIWQLETWNWPQEWSRASWFSFFSYPGTVRSLPTDCVVCNQKNLPHSSEKHHTHRVLEDHGNGNKK